MKHQLTGVDVQHVKKQISACIKLYHRDFKEEAEAFYEFVRQKRAGLHNEGGEHVDGVDHAIDRALFEMPVELYGFITQNLSPEQFVWFKTKEGGRWFAKTFKSYALIENI
jgi:hypothetical protein